MKHLQADHGIVCRLTGERFGYFGWPSVARKDNGTLVAASSGLRTQHVCPWGKTVLHVSDDDGQTWSPSRIINDSLLDDRDAGIVSLGDARLLVSWFTTDNRACLHDEGFRQWLGDAEVDSWRVPLGKVTDEVAAQGQGSWIMLSADGGTSWSAPLRVPVSTPHGPIRLQSGNLLYLGKRYLTPDDIHDSFITAAGSCDGGLTWQVLGEAPVYPGSDAANYHEPHVVELPSGRLLGMIRIEDAPGHELTACGLMPFSMMQTESDDGGHTWSTVRPLGFHGSPPHLLRHTTGALMLTYGFRQEPYGQRVAISRDDGASWDHDWILRDDGPDWDLRYPCTVEMGDGSLFTVYYQKVAASEPCSLLWSHWTLPAG